MSTRESLIELLRVEYGLDPSRGGMASSLARHVERRLEQLEIDEPSFVDRVHSNVDAERVHLVHAVTVRHSWFHRDHAQLDKLSALLRARHEQAPGRPLQLWSAGCAGGEEAWTLAMLAAEHEIPVRVLATDVDTLAIDNARTGRYGAWSLRELPARLQRYVTPEADGPDPSWLVDPSLRDKIEFAVHNLCDPAPARSFDLICCRNVLIYFEASRATAVILGLRERLRPDGELVLGAGEFMFGADSLRPRTTPAPTRLASNEPRSVSIDSTPTNISTASTNEDPLARAGLAVQAGQYDQALQLIAALVPDDPLGVEAHLWTGIANYELGRYQAASEALRRARFLAPALWPATLFAALTHERRGRWVAAQRCWIELEESLTPCDVTTITGTIALRRAASRWRGEAFALARQRNITHASQTRNPRMNDTAASPRATILVVDDSPLVLDIVRDVLEERGFRVVTTSAPLECKRLLEAHEPDVLVVDIEMPVLDGPALLDLVRRRSTHRCVVLLFSDRGHADLATTIRACGADGGAKKTPDCGELISAIEANLEHRARPPSYRADPV